MNLKKRLAKLPLAVRKLIKAVSFCADKRGIKAYLVGGIVRDLSLNKANLDLDVVVEADAIDFAKILSSYLKCDFRRHHAFRTATVFTIPHKIDLATSRKEFYPYPGSLPKVEKSSLEDDLARRDFSVNAMALSLNKKDFGSVIDYFGGISDLKKGLIRVLHKDSFFDDPTRLLRAIRFKERLGFKLDRASQAWFDQAAKKKALRLVNEQRLRDEIVLILKEKDPIRCIKSLAKTTGLGFIGIRSLTRDDIALLKRIAKSIAWFDREFPGHRSIEPWIIYLMGMLVKLSALKTGRVLSKFAFRRGERIMILSSKKTGVLRRLSSRLSAAKIHKLLDPLSFETIIFFYALSRSSLARQNIGEFLGTHSKVRLDIKGGTLAKLGIKPPVLYSKILRKIFYKKIEGKIRTKKDEIKEARKYLK